MARKQQHSNKSKGRKTAKAVVQTSRPQASASSHKHDVPLYAEFMRSEWFSIAGHLLLFGIIFAIACTKGVPDFTKETIKRQ